MSSNRPTPFELVFQQIAQDAFPRIRAALQQGGHPAGNRDRFLMEREVVSLVRELRPEEGLGQGIDQLAALVHHAYLFWDAGEHTFGLSPERLAELLESRGEYEAAEPPAAYYVQAPEWRVWAEAVPGQPPEPLEGCFVHASTGNDSLRVLGVFGIRPEREGFSVVEAEGPRPVSLRREDGTPLFAPVLAGGAAAGLFSLVGAEELLELGWRTRSAAESSAGAGRWRA